MPGFPKHLYYLKIDRNKCVFCTLKYFFGFLFKKRKSYLPLSYQNNLTKKILLLVRAKDAKELDIQVFQDCVQQLGTVSNILRPEIIRRE